MLSSKFDELKVVSFCPINYEEVIIYHHHFKSNKGLFIEAPIFQVGNFSKILVACLDQEFFESLKHVFNSLFEAENVINEGKISQLNRIFFSYQSSLIAKKNIDFFIKLNYFF